MSIVGIGSAGTGGSVDALSDVDTTTSAPTTGDMLQWDGSNWVPAASYGVETFIIRPADTGNGSGIIYGTTAAALYKMPYASFSPNPFNDRVAFSFIMPNRWDKGQARYRVLWMPTTTNVGTVLWSATFQGLADQASDPPSGEMGGDSVDTSSGTANTPHLSPWSAWLTMLGTPSTDALVYGRMQRYSAMDTYTGEAQMLLLEIQYTANAATDD